MDLLTMLAIFAIDGYKLDHRRQYPFGLQYVLSNWTPRGTRIPDQDFMVWIGHQHYIKGFLLKVFNEQFFGQDRGKVCDAYQRFVDGYIGPNDIGTQHISDLHDLGYLPLEICALPEGTHVPFGVPALTSINTHPEFGWIVNYLETIQSANLWLPSNSATTAWRSRQRLLAAAHETGSDPAFVDWQGHDFSFRGMGGMEAAILSGIGHLALFTGTDTIPAIIAIMSHYSNGLPDDYLIGGSVPATEHSVVCAGGYGQEIDTLGRLLALYPTGILSYVSDTWDLWKLLTETVVDLREVILARDGKLVIRPDSGDPVRILCGDPDAPVGSPAYKGVVELLWEVFGGSATSTGHRLLDPHIGVIYGDGISEDREVAILHGLARKGFASGNVVFGDGSYRYQYATRDVYAQAMKATWAQIDDVGHDLFKDPITDTGDKRSAKGRLAVLYDDNHQLTLVQQASDADIFRSLLRPVLRDGQLLIDEGWHTIRARAQGVAS